MTEWTTERRPEDDAECERLGCEDRTHPVEHYAGPADRGAPTGRWRAVGLTDTAVLASRLDEARNRPVKAGTMEEYRVTVEIGELAAEVARADAALRSEIETVESTLQDHYPGIGSWIDDSTWLTCSCGWDSSEPKAPSWPDHLLTALRQPA